MNTVFKFYYQVWVCFSLGGALAFSLLIRRALDLRPLARARDVWSITHHRRRRQRVYRVRRAAAARSRRASRRACSGCSRWRCCWAAR